MNKMEKIYSTEWIFNSDCKFSLHITFWQAAKPNINTLTILHKYYRPYTWYIFIYISRHCEIIIVDQTSNNPTSQNDDVFWVYDRIYKHVTNCMFLSVSCGYLTTKWVDWFWIAKCCYRLFIWSVIGYIMQSGFLLFNNTCYIIKWYDGLGSPLLCILLIGKYIFSIKSI